MAPRTPNLRFVLLGIILVIVGFSIVSGSAETLSAAKRSQGRERIISRMPFEQNEPLAITDIKVNGQSVSFDKKFVADDDWMRTLVISVKSKSDKLILFAGLDLFFPRPADSKELIAVYDIFHGNYALTRRPPTPNERIIGLAPGETVDIRLSVQKFVGLTKFLTETGFPQSPERVDMGFGRVIFEDDTMWYAGGQFRRDSNNPSAWNNVSP